MGKLEGRARFGEFGRARQFARPTDTKVVLISRQRCGRLFLQSLKGPPLSVGFLKFADTATERGAGESVSAAGGAQGVALNYCRGRVVVVGEAGQLSAQLVGNPPQPMGMNVPGCDNRKMALNVMQWLTGLID
jgi:hypothetical protein